MRISFTRLAVILATIFLMSPTNASVQAPIVPGQPGSSATGTGFIVGKVIDGTTNRPVSNALVSIVRSSGDAAPAPVPGVPQASPQVLTGNDGAFLFRSLPKGDFSVRVQAPGYLAALGIDGRRPGGSTQTLTLAEGERINDVTIRLWRAASIAGQVIEETGEPVEGVFVSVLSIDRSSGQKMLSGLRAAITDDRGIYRLAGLMPGDYVACVLFNRHVVPIAAGAGLQAAQSKPGGSRDLDRSLSGSGAPPVIGSSGYRIGDHLLTTSSGPRNLDPAPGAGGLQIYTSVCYPSAPTLQSASPITLKSGEDRTGITLPIRLVPALRILGTVNGPTGPMGYVGVHLLPAGAEDTSNEIQIEASSTLSDPSGAFGFVGVGPGNYTLRVTLQIPGTGPLTPIAVEGGTVFVSGGVSGVLPTDPMLWARMPIAVSDTDVTGIAVTLQPGARLSGHVVFDGTRPAPTGEQIGRTQITFDAGGRTFDYFAVPRAKVETNAQFRSTGFVPGKYVVRATSGAPGWMLKSVMSGGRDVSDDPLEIETRDIDDVVVTFTDRPSEISGAVRDDNGAITTNADVVVFPAERSRWGEAGPGPRRGRSTRVSRTGTYSFIGLPPGDYIVAAIDAATSAGWQDPKRLDALSRSGVRVTIGESDKHVQDLKLQRVQ